jgi:large subunit ribosomal protein L21
METNKALPSEFAVIKTGGKQYIVSQDAMIKIEIFKEETKEGDIITFPEVLLYSKDGSAEIGTPFVNKKVTGTVVSVARHPKVRVVKFKSKSNYHKTYGHRQPYLQIKVSFN